MTPVRITGRESSWRKQNDSSILRNTSRFFEGKHSANPQRIVLVVVLVIVIESSQVEHDDEEEDEHDLHSGLAESLPSMFPVEGTRARSHLADRLLVQGLTIPVPPTPALDIPVGLAVTSPLPRRSTLDPDRGYYGEVTAR
jgi:hypothetical protein